MTETPERYLPEQRKHEQKDYLYEKYWGEMLPVREIADGTDVSPQVLRRRMNDFGIPRRVQSYTHDNSVSPFAGFYRTDEPTQTDDESTTVYDPDWQRI